MKVAVLGAGTVGSSVVRMLDRRGYCVTALADSSSGVIDETGIDVSGAFERKREGDHLGDATVEDVLNAEADVVVDATPTTVGDAQPGFRHARVALERDRHVVLANKGPVAERYGDLYDVLLDSDAHLAFEATVGAGIPVLSTIQDIGPESVTAVRGILNGTTNFVLTQMIHSGESYDDALAEAQERGIAESDSTFDVEGIDTGLKCSILANVIRTDTRSVSLEDVAIEGITKVDDRVDRLADDETIRLIAEVDDDTARVEPRTISTDDPLAVPGTTNVVQIETEDAGTFTVSGRGAGGKETAIGVLSDVRRLAVGNR